MHHDIQLFAEYAVTPFVGVWIETRSFAATAAFSRSHPSWVCGLKQQTFAHAATVQGVTPFVGVWIETTMLFDTSNTPKVTPFVGVWIETLVDIGKDRTILVTPFVGVWIET